MTVLATRSAQEPVKGSVYNPRLYAFDQIGKVRFAYATVAAIPAEGEIGSTLDLLRIPQGRVRVLPHLSVLWCSAWGAGCTLDLGFRAYYGSDGKTEVAAVANNVVNDKDMSAALNASQISTLRPVDIFSQASVDERDKGPILFGTVAGAVIPANATLDLLLAYIQN